ncbi:MAG: ketoacyl-ACP synthase III, partial [Nitrospinae bacterium]|nr:ketoacyl-ACP synthase III [Nitrospinota bacterium]
MNTKAYIKGISYSLPDSVLTNESLAEQYPEWSVEKIALKTGITERRISRDDETALDMAVRAVEYFFEEHSFDRNDIDFIIFCSQSPDYLLPSSACILQERAGLPVNIGAFDFNLGCSGYIYGLGLAKGIIETGQARNVLLVTSDTYSKYIHPKDKSVRTIFGDGATATVISSENEHDGSIEYLGPFEYGTDGHGAGNLIVPHGGAKHPWSEKSFIEVEDNNGNIRSPKNLYMNGAEVFSFSLNRVPGLLKSLLRSAGLEKKDVDYFVFHQANKFILDSIRKRTEIP